MSARNTKPLIALDVDGVLLDYSTAYAKAWEKAFGYQPQEVNPGAFWARERWGLPKLEGEELDRLKAVFDEEFWSTIPPLPGAVEACDLLIAQGFELVCVTALDPKWFREREHNLQSLGFRVKSIYPVGGSSQSPTNPKAPLINHMRPAAFVEDFEPFLLGISPDVHRALIRLNSTDGEQFQLGHVDSVHSTLNDFAINLKSLLGL